MGAHPSKATDAQRAELVSREDEMIDRAATAIATSDVLLVCTGAGWSADSGLAVYRDVANVPAYNERNITYHDLCDPVKYFESEPELWWGFWGGCFNDYRNTQPHEGYNIVKDWCDKRFMCRHEVATQMQDAGCDGTFFSLTSNVDAHWIASGFSSSQVYECHGNTESFQCADASCARAHGSWPAPTGFRFAVDEDTRLAPDGAPAVHADRRTTTAGEGGSFEGNWPRCPLCQGMARPAVLMFSDSAWLPNTEAKGRFGKWRAAVHHLAARRSTKPLTATVLEVGCGDNVTTIRQMSESFVRDIDAAGGRATLLRVNPDFPLADSPTARPHTLPLLLRGLDAVTKIDEALRRRARDESTANADPLAGLTFETIDRTAEAAESEENCEREREKEEAKVERGGDARSVKEVDALRSKIREEKLNQARTQPAVYAGQSTSDAIDSCTKLLADLEETRRKFERFDQLGDRLANGMKRVAKQLLAEQVLEKKKGLGGLTVVAEDEGEED